MIENNPMNNEASRKKMAATLKGMFAGVKNPMYGKMVKRDTIERMEKYVNAHQEN